MKVLLEIDSVKPCSFELGWEQLSQLVDSLPDESAFRAVFAALARHPASAVRASVAAKEHLDSDTVDVLSADLEVTVLENVARSASARTVKVDDHQWTPDEDAAAANDEDLESDQPFTDEESSEDLPTADNASELDEVVRAVLESAGSMKHVATFIENEISADVLDTLADADLIALGISALGERKRILQAIRSMHGSADAVLSPRVEDPPVEASKPPHGSANWAGLIEKLWPVLGKQDSVVIAPQPGHKKREGARAYAPDIDANTTVLFVYDDTLFRSAKDGMAATNRGIHWHNQFQEAGFVAWANIQTASADGKNVKLHPSLQLIQTAYGGKATALAIVEAILVVLASLESEGA
jgi:hypothetical protein